MSIKIAAIAGLIAIKKKAGRAQDLGDIKALRKLEGDRGSFSMMSIWSSAGARHLKLFWSSWKASG